MTTEITRYSTPNGTLQRYESAEEEEGSLGLDPADVRPPYVRFNGQTGELLFTHDGTVNEALDVVVLRKLPSTRVYFNPDLDAPNKVLCRSADTVRPVDAEQAAAIGASPSCLSCPYAQFGKDDKGKTTKAPCSEVLNVAVAVVPTADDEMPIPALMALRSTAIKPMKAALSQLEIQHRTARRPAYSWVVTLHAGDRQKDGSKSWFPLAAKVQPQRVPDAQLPAYAALWRLMRDTTVDMATEAEMADAPDEPLPADVITTLAEMDAAVEERDAPMPQWMAVQAASEPSPDQCEEEPDANPLWEELKRQPRTSGDPIDGRRGRRG